MLYFEKHGDTGQPLIILHGLFGSASNWRSIARKLAADFQVYLPDLRNHGRSDWADEMDYAAMASDVAELIEQQALSRPVLAGHSMGGKVAMTLALRDQVELSHLFVIDIAPKAYSHGNEHVDLIAAMQQLSIESINSRSQAEQVLAVNIPQAGIRQFLLQNLVSADTDGYRWRINLTAINNNLQEVMGFEAIDPSATYHGKSAFIRGAESDYVTDADLISIHQYFPKVALHTIENAGHWLHAEQPGALIELLRQQIKL